jgi:uncharacterized protein (TIGR02145 family)
LEYLKFQHQSFFFIKLFHKFEQANSYKLNYIQGIIMNKRPKDLIMRKAIKIFAVVSAFFFMVTCQKEDTLSPLELNAEIQNVTKFGEADGGIDLRVSGGMEPYAFLWSSGDTTEDLNGIPAGMYAVTVTDQTPQTAMDTFEIMQPELEGVMDVDGNIYSIIQIGEQTWMQENLRVKHAPDGSEITSYAYNDDPELIKKYGLLYTWDVAMNGSEEVGTQGICPEGWHLPSDDEWKELEMALGMTQAEADMVNTWRGSPAGTMMKAGGSSGYEAQLAGRRISNGSFSLQGRMEYMWTSNAYGSGMAWRRCLDSESAGVGRWNTFPKSYAFSVRCVKDD